MSKNIKIYYKTEEVTPRWGKMSVDEDVNTSLQKQLLQLSQIIGDSWNKYTLDKALSSIKALLKCKGNSAIFRKEFDKMS